MSFTTLFIVLALVAIVLNALILYVLCRVSRDTNVQASIFTLLKQRNFLSLQQIFYMLVRNFSIVDLLKALCLVLFGVKGLLAGAIV